MKKNIWVKGKLTATSSYERTSRNKDRAFVLTYGKTSKTYESWQAAFNDGWRKASP